MVEPEKQKVKPIQFITITVAEGDAGTYACCPALDMGLGIDSFARDEAIRGLQEIVENNAQVIVRREDITGDTKVLSQRIVEELNQGAQIADLFKPTS